MAAEQLQSPEDVALVTQAPPAAEPLLSPGVVASAVAAPGAAEYLLGPGDVVKIMVYEHPDLTTIARTSEAGGITFPLLGEVAIGGLNAKAVEAKLAELLLVRGFIKHPQVSLNIEQYGSQRISVLGQVNRPGKYAVDSPASTVVDLLSLAGGLNTNAADTIIIIKQEGGKRTKYEIDLVALFQRGDMTQNITVANGDIIFVPRMPMFYIYGEVRTPGTYRLEKNMTVMQAISVGGGLTTRGTERGVAVKRLSDDGAIKTLNVQLSDLLQPTDVVYVKESLF
jgi:polysaccharide export outer membrane protein